MLDQTYSKQSLQLFFRKIRINGMTISRRNSAIEKLEEVSLSIRSRKFEFKSIRKFQRNGKLYYSCNSDVELLIIRYTNNLLKRIFKVKQADRNVITSCVLSNLSNSYGQHIIRADIKSFYESIPYKEMISFIDEDGLLISHAKYILHELYKVTTNDGIPRGIGMSSILAEIYMRSIDEELSKLPGIIYYDRYVDDLIIFTTGEESIILESITNKLPSNFKLNPEKTHVYKVRCRCAEICTCDGGNCNCKLRCRCKPKESETLKLEYLGYDFIFSDVPYDKKKKFEVIQQISDSKVKKIKSRITNSLLDFIRNENFNLLQNRIKFITSNYLVYEDNPNSSLRAGIFYNYSQANSHGPLKELNEYLMKAIYSTNGKFGLRLSSKMTNAYRNSLKKYTFTSGFSDRRMVSFTGQEISAIKRCWRNE